MHYFLFAWFFFFWQNAQYRASLYSIHTEHKSWEYNKYLLHLKQNQFNPSYQSTPSWYIYMICVCNVCIPFHIKESPRGAASGMSGCPSFGWLLISLLSFYHLQTGWNFNMLGVWPCWSTLARGIDHLWSWARFMAAQICHKFSQ